MWFKEYRDYPIDTPLVHTRVTPGRGIVGCEMCEINGWGNTLHHPHGKHETDQPFISGTTDLKENHE